MQKVDRQLIYDFLAENFDCFQDFLDGHDVEPSEAEHILDDLISEPSPL